MKRNTGLIVLHTTRFGENSIVLHTLSKEYGRRSFLVKGAGKKSMMTLFLPLNILEAEVTESSRSTLYTAQHIVSGCSLIGIRNSIFKNTICLFISEVLYRLLKDGAMEQGLYEWCEKEILLLNALDKDFSNFHIRFLLELTVVLGFGPETQDMLPFVGEYHPVVAEFLKKDFAESMLIPLSGTARNEMAEGIIRYMEFHTDSSININSLKVLREFFL